VQVTRNTPLKHEIAYWWLENRILQNKVAIALAAERNSHRLLLQHIIM